MGLSNLPPGCRDSDIPGNRPEDIADEQIRDNIETALKPLIHHLDINMIEVEQTIENLFKLINNAWESGYQAAVSNADEARSYAALEHCDDARLDDRQQENERRIQAEDVECRREEDSQKAKDYGS